MVNEVMVATVKLMTSTLPKGTLGSVASLLVSTLYQGNPDRNHKLWNIVSTMPNSIINFHFAREIN
jgi:hypothetical protein